MIEYYTALLGLSAPQNQLGFLPLAIPTHYEWDDTSALIANRIIGIDSRYAIEEVLYGAVNTENDKLMDGNIERTAITFHAEYPVFDNNAVCLWTET